MNDGISTANKYGRFDGGHITLWPDMYNSSSGTWIWHTYDTAQGFGAQFTDTSFYNSSHDDGDSLTYKVALSPGTYKALIFNVKGPGFCIEKLDFDGSNVGTWDLYNAGGDTFNHRNASSFDVTSPGIKDLKLYADGKNDNSSDHYLVFTYIALWRTS